ncbi:hypothetical protein QMA10_04925, partial [Arthrobacter sp. APC 3897]|uniref:hypothetical protein n=1 Tax=Arthrobacter sp. APC 3897 TaxID=3035204 RepID=UPI0025B38F95
RKQPVQPIKIIGINKLGTLLSSQTTDASEILGKTMNVFLFSSLQCFFILFHPDRIWQFGVFPKRASYCPADPAQKPRLSAPGP